MKKILLSSLVLLAIAGTTMAQNRVYVPDFEISPNGDVVDMAINIELDAADYYTAFEANIELPEGFTYQFDGETTDIVYEEGDCLSDHGVSPNFSEGIAKVVVVSMNSKAFKGTSGTTAWLKVIPPTDVEIGQTFTGTIKDIVLVPILGAKQKLDAQEFTITVGDGRVKLNENATEIPEEASGVNVTVLRTIKANEWSTLCLPFAITADQMATAFGEGVEVKVADFQGTDPTFDDDDNVVSVKANFATIGAIEANHPYIIRVSEKVDEIKVDGVTIAPNEDEAFIEFDNGLTGRKRVVYSGFYGTYRAGTVLENNTLFLYDNKFYYSKGSTKMKAFRAYFDFLDVLPEFEAAKLSFYVDDAPTRIEGLSHDGVEDGAIYTLGGQLVGKDVRIDQLPKGVYIINGKKRVVK